MWVVVYILWSRLSKIGVRSPFFDKSRSKTAPEEHVSVVHQPVKYYENRHALPIEQFLKNVQTVEMVAITYSDLSGHNIDLIRKPLANGAHALNIYPQHY